MDNSLVSKQLKGRKQSKERLTLALCCNGDGSDKLPLWVISKFKNPRCFKNINVMSFGCVYRNNASAWMTQIIFLEWLRAFDLHVFGRKVFLILDNFSGHTPVEKIPDHIRLRNTTILYLPPNMTSKIQPCDAGIIRNFKAYYIVAASTVLFSSALRTRCRSWKRSTLWGPSSLPSPRGIMKSSQRRLPIASYTARSG